jgi:type IV secretory pathway component VirB8
MWSWRRLARLGPDFEGLQHTAERAGHAWGCPFASSAEFEAANIQAKREAGVYGPKRQRRQVIWATVIVVTVVSAVLAFSLAHLS